MAGSSTPSRGDNSTGENPGARPSSKPQRAWGASSVSLSSTLGRVSSWLRNTARAEREWAASLLRSALARATRVGHNSSQSLVSAAKGTVASADERLRATIQAERERTASLLRSASTRATKVGHNASQFFVSAAKDETERARERLRAVVQVERERAASLLHSTSARITQAGRNASQSAMGAAKGAIPDVSSRLIRVRNRLFGGALAVVFMYALGSAIPSAVAQYRLESQRRSFQEEREAARNREAEKAVNAPLTQATVASDSGWRSWMRRLAPSSGSDRVR